MNKSTAYIHRVDVIAGDVFYKVEINHKGEVQFETLCAESMQELIRRNDMEVSYNEEFETEDFTIEQMLDQDNMSLVEIDEQEGEYDVYFHKVTVKYGEVEYDAEGEFIRTYKTEKGAVNRAKKFGCKIV